MSQDINKQAETAMAEAQQVLFSQVFVPAFVKLAADKGVNISTQEELDEALKIAYMLESAQTQKQASEKPILKQASEALQARLYGANKQSDVADFSKQAASTQEVRDAVAKAVKALNSI